MTSKLSAGSQVLAWAKTHPRGLAVLTVSLALAGAALALTSVNAGRSDVGTARQALSELSSAHAKLVAAEKTFEQRKCTKADALDCEVRYSSALRRQLLTYAATVKQVKLPTATEQALANRQVRAAHESANVIAHIDKSKSIAQYNSLANSFTAALGGNYYELEDNATYLDTMLKKSS